MHPARRPMTQRMIQLGTGQTVTETRGMGAAGTDGGTWGPPVSD